MTDNAKWTAYDIPDQTGKFAVVTGANSGLGYETVRGLARKNAQVILACRNPEKGQAAVSRLQAEFPQATLFLIPLDLADLVSVRAFAQEFCTRFEQLHILVNNAGIMGPPYQQTATGAELQFGTNHLGHFALTGLLLAPITNTPGARVVTVSSDWHRRGVLDFEDLHWQKGYNSWGAYGRAKLANLLFAYELQRKFEAAQIDAMSVAAHPGFATTNLQAERDAFLQKTMVRLLEKLVAQSAEKGAWPQLYAATMPDVVGGSYYGPGGFRGIRGHPVQTKSSPQSYNLEDAARLWAVSTEMTGVDYAKRNS